MSSKIPAKPELSERIAAFFSHHRRILMILSVVLIVGVFAAIAIYQVQENRADRSARQAELLVQDFQRWQDSGDARDSAAEEAIRADAASIQNDFSGTYGALRALHTLGRLEYELENYGAAREAFLEIVIRFPESHLVAIALAGAAAAAEEEGETALAREFLTRIADGEGEPSIEQGRALFNLGRLAEQAGDFTAALDYYQQLSDRFPSGNWTNLGRNRIIALTIEGVRSDR